MAKYRVTATLDIEATQHGRPVAEVMASKRQLGQTLTKAVNDLLLNDEELRRRLWDAAGGGDNFNGSMQLTANDVSEV